MNYLYLLPDDVYRMVCKYMYAESMDGILRRIPLATGIWPPRELVFALQNGSDHVRSQSINNSYRRGIRHYRESDWFKLLIDMERPSAFHLSTYGFNSWMLRRFKVFDVSPNGSFWWSSCSQPTKLTYAGWVRLLAEGT